MQQRFTHLGNYKDVSAMLKKHAERNHFKFDRFTTPHPIIHIPHKLKRNN